TCLHHFKYQGRKKIHDLSIIGDSRKALTMPASRRSMPTLIPGSGSMNSRTYSQYSDLNSESGTLPSHVPSQTSSSEADALVKALQEANMSTEVGLAVLDILSLYCNFFKKNLEYKDGDNSLMQRVFELHLYFLQHSQSETLQKHVFAALRQFIRKFENVLYRGNAKLCGDLCYEILRSCNSKLYSTRKEACALLYLLMRQNFEHTKKKSVIRVHLQVIISVNKLIGNVVGLSNSHLQESLAMINSYASSDRQMQRRNKQKKSGFPAEVKDLTKKIRTVLMATAQMKEHEKDPEMLIDLQYSLAKSYDSTPELRKTWLDSMAKIHLKHGNYSEEAHCFIHIAALIAEYLKRRGCFPQGCAAFKLISPNVEKEESGIKDDSGMQDVQYTEETMVEYLEKASRSLEVAERYEMLGEIYKLVIPIYEFNRDYELSVFIERMTTKFRSPHPVGKRVVVTLWRLATNIEFRTLGHLFGMGRSTACMIFHDVVDAINSILLPKFLKFSTGQALRNTIDGFRTRWGFPQCCGAIDGTHIQIIAPKEHHADYYNRKCHHSVLLQAVVDYNYRFSNINVGHAGKQHDAHVLRELSVFLKASAGELLPNWTIIC
ncbi:Hypothetical predicted protein, partial [Mytilus galloprovincialis]